MRCVQDLSACAEIGHLVLVFWCTKDERPDHFSIIGQNWGQSTRLFWVEFHGPWSLEGAASRDRTHYTTRCKLLLYQPGHQSLSVIWWRMGQMHHKLAQLVGHGKLLNLFFSSIQTDNQLVAEIWSFHILGRWGAPKLSFQRTFHWVYMRWKHTMCKLGANQNCMQTFTSSDWGVGVFQNTSSDWGVGVYSWFTCLDMACLCKLSANFLKVYVTVFS
jgi:hypothetical protein